MAHNPDDWYEDNVDYITGHYTKVLDEGRWKREFPNFTPYELRSKDNGMVMVYVPALCALQRVRDRLGRTMIINSAFRTASHNAAVKGSPKSQHLIGRAFDIKLSRGIQEGPLIEKLAREEGFTGIGRYKSFIHIDMRSDPRFTPEDPAEFGDLTRWPR